MTVEQEKTGRSRYRNRISSRIRIRSRRRARSRNKITCKSIIGAGAKAGERTKILVRAEPGPEE